MAFCPGCGTQVSEGARFCPKCGRPLAAGRAVGGESKKKLIGIIVACTIAIIVIVVLATRPTTPLAQTHTLTININPLGAGSVSPSGGKYESGLQVTLVASPASGYTFIDWSGSASGTTSDITITMDSDKTLTANFETIQASIDDLFLDLVDTTYYGNWMLSKELVRELEGARVEAELSEADIIDLWVEIFRECTNWVDLYTLDKFDCSEMSALFECMMEQTGYQTYVAASHKYGHAWCLVKTEEGYLPVECTGMFIPWQGSSDLTWDNYFDYEKLFETIYEGEEDSLGEFDWWNSVPLEDLTFDEAKMNEVVSEWVENHVGQ